MKKNKLPNIKDFANDMMDRMNKTFGKKVYFNLGTEDNPAKINRWYSTNCRVLDWICNGFYEGKGGVPGGRMIEIFGPESIGKSHICYQIAKGILDNGGIVLYIDTELASSTVPNLSDLGIDVSDKRLFWSKVDSIEGVFEAAEEFLKELAPFGKTIPIGVIWDSVGGIGSRIEKDMSFDDIQRPGLNAKQITFGLRKIMPAINESSAVFVVVNQQYDIIGASKYEKSTQTKGGGGLKYGKSIALEIKGVTQVYPEDLERKKAIAKGYQPCGIRVRARTPKNKVAAPYRAIEFDIHFGIGLKEHMTLWDMFIKEGKIKIKDKTYVFSGGGWKTIVILDSNDKQIEEIKFRQSEIEHMLMKKYYNEITLPCMDLLMGRMMQKNNKEAEVREIGDDEDGRVPFDEDEAMNDI